MPWCDQCDCHIDADSAKDCPVCDSSLDTADTKVRSKTKDNKPPWHFWLILVLLSGYLLWRLVDLIIWLASRAFG